MSANQRLNTFVKHFFFIKLKTSLEDTDTHVLNIILNEWQHYFARQAQHY